jgi:hypothetical protein
MADKKKDNKEKKASVKPLWASIMLLLSIVIWAGALGGSLIASPDLIENVPLDLILGGGASGQIEGQVLDLQTGNPIASARVQIGRERAVPTDSQGYYRIDSAPIGIQHVTINSKGYQSVKMRVMVWPRAWSKGNPNLQPIEIADLTPGAPGQQTSMDGESISRLSGLITMMRLAVGIDGIFAAFAIVSFVLLMQRKFYRYTFIFSLLAIGCVPFITGLIAFILVWLSKNQFS